MGIDASARKLANEANVRRWELANQYPIDKACPFCNRTMAIVERDIDNDDLYLVKCRECYAITPRASTPEKAIELWNDEVFPDYIWLTDKNLPYVNDPDIWGDLKNAVVLASFDEYKKERKLAIKNWQHISAYANHMQKAEAEKKFFLSEGFCLFSDISGKKIIDVANKQASYDVKFREPNQCRGCGNNKCKHQKYIWWLWERGNEYDVCEGWKKRNTKRDTKYRVGARLYPTEPR